MTITDKRLAEIMAIKDEDIDTSDIPEADEAFFARARRVPPVQRRGRRTPLAG
jgi:hypothetical protein